MIFKKGNEVKIIGGNNEVGQPTMINKVGIIKSFGSEYLVKGKKAIEVYVEFEHFGLHIFNNYHLELTN